MAALLPDDAECEEPGIIRFDDAVASHQQLIMDEECARAMQVRKKIKLKIIQVATSTILMMLEQPLNPREIPRIMTARWIRNVLPKYKLRKMLAACKGLSISFVFKTTQRTFKRDGWTI